MPLESVFTFLFKYRPLVFRRGEFAFGATTSTAWLIALALLAAIGMALTYAWVRAETSRRDRILLATSRIGLLALLCFCLLRPTLSVSSLVEQRGYLAVLIDDSRSMSIRDDGRQTRAESMQTLVGPNADVRRRLEERFRVRYYRFAESAARAAPDSLTQSGAATDVGNALEHVTQDMAGLPLAGIVLVSDGADNAQRDLSDALLPLRASNIPVFSVGVGKEDVQRDVQLSRIALPGSVLKQATVVADIELRHAGFGGETVRVEIEDAGKLLAREDVRLERGTDFTNVKLNFTAQESGPRQLRVRVVPANGEKLLQNNERAALLEVHNRREKILLVEGEPRHEGKFTRRALADEKNLQLVVLQRTAPEKFLRLDVDSAAELANGFPKTRRELFAYRALILGNIEASFFTLEQMQLIAEFVSRRGGGLLMTGGPRSFGEGGWAGTPVADALPVNLQRGGGERKFIQIKAAPTGAGAAHPITRLPTSWQTLPELSSANVTGGLKPGAVALLQAGTSGTPILSQQRYGRGVALAFTAQDSWLWQMHAAVAVDDQTHETFWRQLLRYLVQEAAEPVQVSVPPIVRTDQSITLSAIVEDSIFAGVNDAVVSARVRSPSGVESNVPASWKGGADGEFAASLALREPGLHEVIVEARQGDRLIGSSTRFVEASSSDIEYFDPQARSSTLKRIAEETGGRFYDAAGVRGLADDITLLGRGETVRERKDLWDMPIIFILLVTLACVEWLYRRRKGLV